MQILTKKSGGGKNYLTHLSRWLLGVVFSCDAVAQKLLLHQ